MPDLGYSSVGAWRLIAFSLPCACAVAGPRDADPRDNDALGTCFTALINGVEADDAADDSIGSLGVLGPDGAFHAFCSGTLVAPDTILTAKHCAQYTDAKIAGVPVYFALGASSERPIRVILTNGYRLSLPHTGGVAELGSDVATFTLLEAVTDINPMKVSTTLVDASLLGAELQLYGYGSDVPGCQHSAPFEPRRRMGNVVLSALSGNVFNLMYGTLETYREHAALTRTAKDLERRYRHGELLEGYEAWVTPGEGAAQPCHGDSGGPVIIQRAGVRHIVGVISWTWTTEHELCALGAVVAIFGSETSKLLVEGAHEIVPTPPPTTP